MKKPVRTKLDFYKRFAREEFGNRGPMWGTLAEWRTSGYTGEIGMRTKGVGTRCDYNVPHNDVERRYKEFLQTYPANLVNFSAMMPDHHMRVQGELTRTHRGLAFFGATIKSLPMRPALRDHGFDLSGLAVKLMLQQKCDTTSYEWLMTLLDDYPDHTIEFSTLSVPWGTMADLGLNTVVWEVRLY